MGTAGAWDCLGPNSRNSTRSRGRVNVDVLLRVGERAKSLLKEFEGQVGQETSSSALASDEFSSAEKSSTNAAQAFVVGAQTWVHLNRRSNADLIAEISQLVDEAIRLAKSTNLPIQDRALSEIERAQLIALLETAIQLLKAPLVEKGLIATLRDAAKAGAVNTIVKKTELALGYGLGKIAELLIQLLGRLG